MQELTRKFTLAADVDLAMVTAQLPRKQSGADLYALCASALTRALHEYGREAPCAGGLGRRDCRAEAEAEGVEAAAPAIMVSARHFSS